MSSTDRRKDGRTRWIQYTPPPTSLGGGIMKSAIILITLSPIVRYHCRFVASATECQFASCWTSPVVWPASFSKSRSVKAGVCSPNRLQTGLVYLSGQGLENQWTSIIRCWTLIHGLVCWGMRACGVGTAAGMASPAGSATLAKSAVPAWSSTFAESAAFAELALLAGSATFVGSADPAGLSTLAGCTGDWMTVMVLRSVCSGTGQVELEVFRSISFLDTCGDPAWSVESPLCCLEWCWEDRDLWSTVALNDCWESWDSVALDETCWSRRGLRVSTVPGLWAETAWCGRRACPLTALVPPGWVTSGWLCPRRPMASWWSPMMILVSAIIIMVIRPPSPGWAIGPGGSNHHRHTWRHCLAGIMGTLGRGGWLVLPHWVVLRPGRPVDLLLDVLRSVYFDGIVHRIMRLLRGSCCIAFLLEVHTALSWASHFSRSQTLFACVIWRVSSAQRQPIIQTTLLATLMIVAVSTKMRAPREFQLGFLRRRAIIWLCHLAKLDR